MIQLILSGKVAFAFSGGIQSRYPGKVKTIAATSSSRLANYPNTQTLIEAGFDGLAIDAPTVVAFPVGIDPAIVKKMEAALKVASTDPAMIKISEAIKMPIKYMTAEQATTLASTSKTDIAKTLKAINYQKK